MHQHINDFRMIHDKYIVKETPFFFNDPLSSKYTSRTVRNNINWVLVNGCLLLLHIEVGSPVGQGAPKYCAKSI